jgi:hypothetical protein
MGAAIVSPIVLERDDGSSNRHPSNFFFDLSTIFPEKREPPFRITLWKRSILQWFARQRKPQSSCESRLRGRSTIGSPLRTRTQSPAALISGSSLRQDQYFAIAEGKVGQASASTFAEIVQRAILPSRR